MKQRALSGTVALALLAILVANAVPVSAVDTLEDSDFKLQSWSKSIDFLDFVREWASQNNQTPPSDDSHAYMYLHTASEFLKH